MVSSSLKNGKGGLNNVFFGDFLYWHAEIENKFRPNNSFYQTVGREKYCIYDLNPPLNSYVSPIHFEKKPIYCTRISQFNFNVSFLINCYISLKINKDATI